MFLAWSSFSETHTIPFFTCMTFCFSTKYDYLIYGSNGCHVYQIFLCNQNVFVLIWLLQQTKNNNRNGKLQSALRTSIHRMQTLIMLIFTWNACKICSCCRNDRANNILKNLFVSLSFLYTDARPTSCSFLQTSWLQWNPHPLTSTLGNAVWTSIQTTVKNSW